MVVEEKLRGCVSVLTWGALLWGLPVGLLVAVCEGLSGSCGLMPDSPLAGCGVFTSAMACAGWWAIFAGAGALFWWMLTRVTGARWSNPLVPAWRRSMHFLCATGWGLLVWARVTPFYAGGHGSYLGSEGLGYFTQALGPAAIVLGALWVMAVLLRRVERVEKRARFVAAVGLIVLVPLMAWMAVLRDGGWVTSMAPLNGIADAAVAGLAWALLSREVRADAVRRPTLLLLMAALALGLYFAYSRFLIVSYGAIPAETSFYEVRSAGEWGVLFVVLAVSSVALPLLAALAATVGRSLALARIAAVLVLAATVASACWNALPGVSSSAWVCLALMVLSLLPVAGSFLWGSRRNSPGKGGI